MRPGLRRFRRLTAMKRVSLRRRVRCLESGDFVRVRFQDEARNKKPIGIQKSGPALISGKAGYPARICRSWRLTKVTIFCSTCGSSSRRNNICLRASYLSGARIRLTQRDSRRRPWVKRFSTRPCLRIGIAIARRWRRFGQRSQGRASWVGWPRLVAPHRRGAFQWGSVFGTAQLPRGAPAQEKSTA